MLQILKIYVSKIFLDFYLLIKGFILSFFISKKGMNEEIDFVVLWVDGNDPKWRSTKVEYEKKYNIYKGSNGEERYREWNQFHYWFRAVEKYAPWVRHVYLVTCGQVPDWLNTNHPKLRLVNHIDFMDKNDLPTFNSSAIEINLHHIEELGEYFVYFNDDMILTKPVKPEDFFQGGKPLTSAAGFPIRNSVANEVFRHNLFTMEGLAAKYNWEEIIRKWPEKWFNHKYGKYLRHNWRICKDLYMSGFHYVHFASPLRKSTLERTEQEFKKAFKETSHNRFRCPSDITQLLFKINDIAHGDYIPCSPYYFGHYYNLAQGYKVISNDIKKQRHLMVCINDNPDVTKENFETIRSSISEALESILPEKSTYEL